MKVKDLMVVDVEVLDPEASLEEAAHIMSDADVGTLPVIEGQRVVGVLTDRDIVVRAVAEGLDPASTKAADIMTPDVVHCLEDAEVEEAERLMAENRIRRLVILNRAGELAGILALADLGVVDAAEREERAAETLAAAPAGGESATDGLVRGELAAVETYKQALRGMKESEAGAAELRRIEAEHEEAVQLLSEHLEKQGRAAPGESGLWGAWSRAVEGTAKVFGSPAALKALKEGEEHGIHDYEDALRDASVDPRLKELISTSLLPRTRAHVPVLDRFIGTRH